MLHLYSQSLGASKQGNELLKTFFQQVLEQGHIHTPPPLLDDIHIQNSLRSRNVDGVRDCQHEDIVLGLRMGVGSCIFTALGSLRPGTAGCQAALHPTHTCRFGSTLFRYQEKMPYKANGQRSSPTRAPDHVCRASGVTPVWARSRIGGGREAGQGTTWRRCGLAMRADHGALGPQLQGTIHRSFSYD